MAKKGDKTSRKKTAKEAKASPAVEAGGSAQPRAYDPAEPAQLHISRAGTEAALASCAGILSTVEYAIAEASRACKSHVGPRTRSRLPSPSTASRTFPDVPSFPDIPSARSQRRAPVGRSSVSSHQDQIQHFVDQQAQAAVGRVLGRLGKTSAEPEGEALRIARRIEQSLAGQEDRLLERLTNHVTQAIDRLEQSLPNRIDAILQERHEEGAPASPPRPRVGLGGQIEEVRTAHPGFSMLELDVSRLSEISDRAVFADFSSPMVEEVELGGLTDDLELGGPDLEDTDLLVGVERPVNGGSQPAVVYIESDHSQEDLAIETARFEAEELAEIDLLRSDSSAGSGEFDSAVLSETDQEVILTEADVPPSLVETSEMPSFGAIDLGAEQTLEDLPSVTSSESSDLWNSDFGVDESGESSGDSDGDAESLELSEDLDSVSGEFVELEEVGAEGQDAEPGRVGGEASLPLVLDEEDSLPLVLDEAAAVPASAQLDFAQALPAAAPGDSGSMDELPQWLDGDLETEQPPAVNSLSLDTSEVNLDPQAELNEGQSGSGPQEDEAPKEDENSQEAAPADEEDNPFGSETEIEMRLQHAAELRSRRQLGESINQYSEILSMDEENYEARIGRGVVHLESRDYDRAAKEFRMAETIDPERPAASLGLAEVAFHRKAFDEAVDHYSRCLDLDPTVAKAYRNRGLCFYHRKNYEAAATDLEQAFEIQPELPNLRKYLQVVQNKLRASQRRSAASEN